MSSSSRTISWKIYLNHVLSSWGDRMWAFSVGLYLVILYPQSLLVTAILGFAVCLSVIISGSTIGKWIDRNERLKVATTALVMENGFVVLGSVLLSLDIVYKERIELVWNGYLQYLMFGLIIAATVASHLGSIASDIAIEKDWIVVLSEGDEKKLAAMNSTMRSIDLTTHILAPLIMGQIITFGSPLTGAIFLALWNTISAFIEYWLLVVIYKETPSLANKTDLGFRNLEIHDAKAGLRGWSMYLKHRIKLAGFAFAFLFMTVMGFDSITVGYIYSQGGSESFIGILTATGALFGIMASVSFPYLRQSMGNYSTGNIGFGLNVLFLLFCVGSIFAPGSPFDPSSILNPFTSPVLNADEHEVKSLAQLWRENVNIFFFVFGVVLARFGLWIADLSVTQIIQENVVESQRGIINGVQNSMNQIMDLLKFFLIICIPSAQGFGYLVMLSWLFMVAAWTCFIIFCCTDKEEISELSSEERLGEKQPLLQKDSINDSYL